MLLVVDKLRFIKIILIKLIVYYLVKLIYYYWEFSKNNCILI